MIAAQTSNARKISEDSTVYGAVTIGELWRFLILEEATVQIDAHSYHMKHIGKIMGIPWFLAVGGAAQA